MLDRQSQGPQCTACGSAMKLTVEPQRAINNARLLTRFMWNRIEFAALLYIAVPSPAIIGDRKRRAFA